MDKVFDQHLKNLIFYGLEYIHLTINEWLILIQNVVNCNGMRILKPLSSCSFGEDVKYQVPEFLKSFITDQATRTDTTEDVEKVVPPSKTNIDGAGSLQIATLKLVPVHGWPPSLLGFTPSALKDAEPLVPV